MEEILKKEGGKDKEIEKKERNERYGSQAKAACKGKGTGSIF